MSVIFLLDFPQYKTKQNKKKTEAMEIFVTIKLWSFLKQKLKSIIYSSWKERNSLPHGKGNKCYCTGFSKVPSWSRMKGILCLVLPPTKVKIYCIYRGLPSPPQTLNFHPKWDTPKRIIISPPLKMPNKNSRKLFNIMNSTHPTGLHKQAANILEMKL